MSYELLGKVRIRTESTIALWRRRADHREMMQAQHKNAFSPEDLEIIDSAFTSAWAVLQVSTSYQAWSNEDALRIALRKKLFAFARHGITDREKLTSLTLKNFGLR